MRASNVIIKPRSAFMGSPLEEVDTYERQSTNAKVGHSPEHMFTVEDKHTHTLTVWPVVSACYAFTLQYAQCHSQAHYPVHPVHLVWTPELVFVGMYMPSFPGFLVKLMGMQERTSIRKRKNK